MSDPHVLLVDDDPAFRRMVAEYLGTHDLRVTAVADGREMTQALEEDAPDLVLLDLRLGAENGLDLLQAVRTDSVVPVILLTAHRKEEIDRVIGLELGADDYLTKPFGLRELLARIRAALRRRRMDSSHPETEKIRRMGFDRWIFDPTRRTLLAEDGEPVSLTKGEFELLSAFVRSPRRPLTREQLMQSTGAHEEVFDRSIDVQILRLRRKIESDPRVPNLIRTERGHGYVLDTDVHEL